MTFHRKKETFWTIKNRIFQSRKKSHFFLKGLIQAFHQKSQILLYLDLVIIRLEKLLSDFAGKKKPVTTIKNRISQNPKIRCFKGVNPCFWSKNTNYLIYLDLVKIRLEIMLSDFTEKKQTFCYFKNRVFQSPQNRIFFEGVNPWFWPKNAKLFST